MICNRCNAEALTKLEIAILLVRNDSIFGIIVNGLVKIIMQLCTVCTERLSTYCFSAYNFFLNLLT